MILSLAMCNAGDSNLYVRMLSNSSVEERKLPHIFAQHHLYSTKNCIICVTHNATN